MEKSLNRGHIVRFEHSLGFRPQKFMLIGKKFMGIVLSNMLQFASGYMVLMMVGSQLKWPLVGRPVSVLIEKNVATVKTLIEEDARYTVQEIEELSGIHSSSVLKILRERLGLCKICARWVPRLLTDEQKQSRLRLASQVIEKYDKCDPPRLEDIVTGDETESIIFNLTLRLKIRFGSHLRATDLSLRAVEKHQISCCMRYSLIRKVQSFKFQSRKVVLSLENFYRESFLIQLVDFCQKRRPCTSVSGIKLLHDNAPAHKSVMVQEYLKESGLDVLDLSPCDFWLFPKLKMLAGHRFESHCGIGSVVYLA